MFDKIPQDEQGNLKVKTFDDGTYFSIDKDTLLSLFPSDKYTDIKQSSNYKGVWKEIMDDLNVKGILN